MCKKRKHQDETEGREYRREVQESATEVVWPRKEARARLRGKKAYAYVTHREGKGAYTRRRQAHKIYV